MSADPIARFNEALRRAFDSEPDVPNAVTLATADAQGRPSARVVLLHKADEAGFVFFTNYTSRKARQLAENPHAALCVHWKSLKEQVRVEGTVSRVAPEQSAAYFNQRPHKSQLAAIASEQSATLASAETLRRRFDDLIAEHGEQKPSRPEYWGGFRLAPSLIEFWFHRDHRLHHRLEYTRDGDAWTTRLLYP